MGQASKAVAGRRVKDGDDEEGGSAGEIEEVEHRKLPFKQSLDPDAPATTDASACRSRTPEYQAATQNNAQERRLKRHINARWPTRLAYIDLV
jgi:hypothetical protein